MDLIEYNKKNSRWNAPAPEYMVAAEDYAITINPEEQHWGHKGQARWQRCYQTIHELISFFPNKIYDIRLQLEISKGGRIHGHGIIAIKDIALFYIDVLPRWQSFCSYEVDTIKDMNVWVEYMEKSSLLLNGFNLHMTNKQPYKDIVKNRESIGKYNPPDIVNYMLKPMSVKCNIEALDDEI